MFSQHQSLITKYLLRESGILIGYEPPGQPLAENHRCTANNTSWWKIPSSVSSSGNTADPRDLRAASALLSDLKALFTAPLRCPPSYDGESINRYVYTVTCL